MCHIVFFFFLQFCNLFELSYAVCVINIMLLTCASDFVFISNQLVILSLHMTKEFSMDTTGAFFDKDKLFDGSKRSPPPLFTDDFIGKYQL